MKAFRFELKGRKVFQNGTKFKTGTDGNDSSIVIAESRDQAIKRLKKAGVKYTLIEEVIPSQRWFLFDVHRKYDYKNYDSKGQYVKKESREEEISKYLKNKK